MYGAILGDMVGAPYEFDRGKKSKQFDMWNDEVHFTDDTVMTIAVLVGFRFQNILKNLRPNKTT